MSTEGIDFKYGPECAYAVQQLARHKMIAKLLVDINADMMVCELEGWDKTEYPRMIAEAVDLERWSGKK